MTAITPGRPALPGAGGGGVAARRAVTRWAFRLLRREWRQQLLVLALLALTVAAAAFSEAAAYNVASLAGPQFGSANHLLQFAGSDPKALKADIAAARKAFGTIQVIGRRFVPIPGSAQTIEYRAEDPHGPYSGPALALTQGRYPTGAGQVAVTTGIAQTLQLHIGSSLSLDGHHRAVAGIVENPSDLNDQFALVSPSSSRPQAVTILLDTTPASFGAFRASFRGPLVWQARGPSTQEKTAAVALALVTVLLLLVSLVAAAGFAAIAARRQRQLGMLAAIGATRKQLRMVMVAGGAMVGAIAAAAGTVSGLALWLAAAPHLQTFAGHRIDPFAIPWSLVALSMVLAVAAATGSAWWPARAAARLPVTLALSTRPPRPRPAHRPALLAGLLIVIGLGCLALANQARPPLIIAGALAMALGILFVSPLAIRALGAAAKRAPVAVRLALRDLARHQARSGAALAAISLALGITTAIIISSATDKAAANAGNLSGTQIAVWIGQPEAADSLVPIRTPAQLGVLAAAVHQIAGSLHHAAVIGLNMPVNPADKPQPGSQGSPAGQPVAGLGAPQDPAATGRGGTYGAIPLYVATPAVLRYLKISPATIGPATDILTVHAGPLVLSTNTTFGNATHVQRHPGPPLHLRTHLAHDPERPAPAALDTDTVRLAHQLQPAPDGRAARGRTGGRRQSRPDRRGQEHPGITSHHQRCGDGCRSAARPGRAGDDRRADPHRGRKRPAHPHRHRSRQHHPAHPHRHHRRHARPARRADRSDWRLPRSSSRTSQRPGRPKPRARPLPHRHHPRHSRRRCP